MKSTITLNDYCTDEPFQIEKDSIQEVIVSRIGKFEYSSLVLKNGARIGVMQNANYLKNVLAIK